MHVGTMREQQVNIRLSDEEAERAHAVASHYGLNLANLFRMLVKEKATALGIKPTSPADPQKASKKR